MEDTNVTNPSPQVTTTPTPEPVQQPQQSSGPTPTPVKKPFPKILLLIILIAIIGITGALVLNKKPSSLPQTSQQSAEKDKTGTAKPQTQQPGMNTYTNTTDKFSVQYPAEMKVKENTVGMGVSTVELRSEENLNEDYLADIQMMTIPNYLAKAIGQDFDEYYNMNDNGSKTITAEDKSRVLTKVKNRTINNLRAFEFRATDASGSDGNVAIGVYIEMGDKILIISTQEDKRESLEAMLANFSYSP